MAAGGEGAQTCGPSRDPARSAFCGGGVGGWVPGPERAEGRSRWDSSAEGAAGALGPRGVRALEVSLWASAASEAWVFGCALRPLLAALRGQAPLQSQLPLPSTCGGGAQAGGGARAAPLPPAAGKSSAASSARPGGRKSVKSNCACARGVRAPSLTSTPRGWAGEVQVLRPRAGQ